MSSFLFQSGTERGDIQTSFGKYDINWNGYNWTSAHLFCQLSGGHLATFETQEEFNAINFTHYTTNAFWIGLSDIFTEGQYIWNYTGQAPSYSAWDNYKPTLSTGYDCVTVYGRTNKWGNWPCSYSIDSVCEYP